MGQDRDHILRDPRHPFDAALPLQHRRRNGHIVQISLLENLLLRVHQEAEETQKNALHPIDKDATVSIPKISEIEISSRCRNHSPIISRFIIEFGLFIDYRINFNTRRNVRVSEKTL